MPTKNTTNKTRQRKKAERRARELKRQQEFAVKRDVERREAIKANRNKPKFHITVPDTQEQVLRKAMLDAGDDMTTVFAGCPNCGGLAIHFFLLSQEHNEVSHSAGCKECGWVDSEKHVSWDPTMSYGEHFGVRPI